MNTWDLIIFDCDGVLVDSEEIAHRVFIELLTSLGIMVSAQRAFQLFRGYSLPACIETIRTTLHKTVPDNLKDLFYQKLFIEFRKSLQPVPGIVSVLARLSVPYCVASSGEHEKMAVSLTVTGLFDLFKGKIYSSQDVKRGKPYPDLFLHAAACCGATPNRCAVIEDSVPGMQAGLAAGMQVFGYVTEDSIREALRPPAFNSVTQFSRMEELPHLLSV